MARFRHFQHKRWRYDRNVDDDVDAIPNAIPKEKPAAYNARLAAKGRRTLLGQKPEIDELTIRLEAGDSIAYLDFTVDEIDALIYELSRLKRFYDVNLHATEEY